MQVGPGKIPARGKYFRPRGFLWRWAGGMGSVERVAEESHIRLQVGTYCSRSLKRKGGSASSSRKEVFEFSCYI